MSRLGRNSATRSNQRQSLVGIVCSSARTSVSPPRSRGPRRAAILAGTCGPGPQVAPQYTQETDEPAHPTPESRLAAFDSLRERDTTLKSDPYSRHNPRAAPSARAANLGGMPHVRQTANRPEARLPRNSRSCAGRHPSPPEDGSPACRRFASETTAPAARMARNRRVRGWNQADRNSSVTVVRAVNSGSRQFASGTTAPAARWRASKRARLKSGRQESFCDGCPQRGPPASRNASPGVRDTVQTKRAAIRDRRPLHSRLRTRRSASITRQSFGSPVRCVSVSSGSAKYSSSRSRSSSSSVGCGIGGGGGGSSGGIRTWR